MMRGSGVASIVAALALSCGASHTQIGREHYRIDCEYGMAECKQVAWRLCPDGYEVQQAKDAAFGTGMTVRCKAPRAAAWSERAARPVKAAPPAAAVATVAPTAAMAGECVRDFQCTQVGARCTDGKCVAPPKELTADEADRCVVRSSGAEPTPIFPTEKAALAYVTSKFATKAVALDFVTQSRGTWVDPGVRCKTLQARREARYIQLVSGPLAGREGWLFTEPAPVDAGVD
jgi:hypothetical protein